MTCKAMDAAPQSVRPKFPIPDEDLARAGFYALLARLFYGPPDPSLLRQLSGAGPMAVADEGAALPRAWNGLRESAAGRDPQALRQEFDELFIGVGKAPVMLYASYYLTGFLMEKPLAALRQDLTTLGIARREEIAEPEDHIAAVADVMRLLIGDTHTPARERTARQREFFLKHLQPWYGGLCAAIAQVPQADFYGRVGAFARAFLDLESEAFQIEGI